MVLKNSGFAPEEVGLLREMEELRRQAAESDRPEEKTVIRQKLHEVEMNCQITVERRHKKK